MVRKAMVRGAMVVIAPFTIVLSTIAPPTIAFSFSDRPPLAHTGGFGEQTCQQCHFDNPLNDPAGQLAIRGLPQRYTPNTSYDIVVALSRPELKRGGFQLAARIAEGPNAGRQAGVLSALDARVNVADTVLAAFGAVLYARHARDTNSPQDSVRWTLKWTAPAKETGAVVFHAAADATNNDDSPLGDYIYALNLLARPSP